MKTEKPVSRIPHGKMWRRKEDSKYVEEINISNISEVSKDNVENNEVIDKNDIHHEGKLRSDVEEYPNVDKDERDEEGDGDCGIYFKIFCISFVK